MRFKNFIFLFIIFFTLYTIISCVKSAKFNVLVKSPSLFTIFQIPIFGGKSNSELKKANLIKPGVYINKNNVLFIYRTEEKNITNVAITGDFIGWNPEGIPLVFENGLWSITIYLNKGLYQYKYILNNSKYIHDPYGQATAPDGKGGRNSIIEIK